MAKSKASSSQFARYIGPVIQAIRELGGSGRPDEAGYIDSSQSGVWTLTEKGRSLGAVTAVEVQQIIREVAARKPPGGTDPVTAAENDKIVPTVSNYREELAQTLQRLPAAGIRALLPLPIELVDGEKLANMLERLELGLRPRQTFELDAAFFDEYLK